MVGRTRSRGLAAVALVLGLATGAAACGSDTGPAQGSAAERAKAAELQTELEPLGIDVETGTLISLYGTDGGKVCEIASDPAAMDREGLLAHPRFPLRRLHVTTEAVAFTEAVISVYCPDQLGAVADHIDGLRVDDES